MFYVINDIYLNKSDIVFIKQLNIQENIYELSKLHPDMEKVREWIFGIGIIRWWIVMAQMKSIVFCTFSEMRVRNPKN